MEQDQQPPKLRRVPDEPFAGTRPITDREPFTVTVLDFPAAEEALETDAPLQVEIPQRVDEQRYPSYLTLGFAVAAVLSFILYQIQFAPLVLRFTHGLQRRIYGERTYEARRPKSAAPVLGPH